MRWEPSLGCRLRGLVIGGFLAESLADHSFLIDGVMYDKYNEQVLGATERSPAKLAHFPLPQ